MNSARARPFCRRMGPGTEVTSRLRRALGGVGTKLAGATLLLLSAVTAALFLYVSRAERERALEAKESAGVLVASLFAHGVQAAVAFDDPKSVEEQVALFLSTPSVVQASAFSVSATGHVNRLASRAREPLDPGFDLGIERALEGGVQRGDGQILVQMPVVGPEGRTLGFARLVLSLADDNAAIACTQRRALWAAVGLGLGLTLVLIALTRSLIVRRLEALARAAQRLQRGEEADVEVRGGDEVAALASAFRAMSAAIGSREREISRRNLDMRRVLDNVDAGFLTVDRAGRMSAERSRVLETWFGPADGDDFFAYVGRLAPVAAHALRNGWRDIDDDFLPIEVILDQLPARIDVGDRSFAFGYAQLHDGAALVGLVVSVKDVTAQVRHEASQRAQREALAIFRRLLDDRAGFASFLVEGGRLLRGIERSEHGREALLRDLHTLKGITSVYDIESVASACHALEDRLAEDDAAHLAPDVVAPLVSAWSNLLHLVTELGGGSHESIDLSREEHDALLAAIRRGASHAELERRVAALAHEPARTSLVRAARHARAIARRLGKGDVHVVTTVSPPDLRLADETWGPVWLAVPHLLRNALDHGIERADARTAAGKDACGQLRLAIADDGRCTTLVVADDGAGIDWAKLRDAAGRRGLPTNTHEDLVRALFEDRVSSCDSVSESSGRGVGTSAVRDAVVTAGGRIHVTSVRGRGTTFTIEIPRRATPSRRVGASRAA